MLWSKFLHCGNLRVLLKKNSEKQLWIIQFPCNLRSKAFVNKDTVSNTQSKPFFNCFKMVEWKWKKGWRPEACGYFFHCWFALNVSFLFWLTCCESFWSLQRTRCWLFWPVISQLFLFLPLTPYICETWKEFHRRKAKLRENVGAKVSNLMGKKC